MAMQNKISIRCDLLPLCKANSSPVWLWKSDGSFKLTSQIHVLQKFLLLMSCHHLEFEDKFRSINLFNLHGITLFLVKSTRKVIEQIWQNGQYLKAGMGLLNSPLKCMSHKKFLLLMSRHHSEFEIKFRSINMSNLHEITLFLVRSPQERSLYRFENRPWLIQHNLPEPF